MINTKTGSDRTLFEEFLLILGFTFNRQGENTGLPGRKDAKCKQGLVERCEFISEKGDILSFGQQVRWT